MSDVDSAATYNILPVCAGYGGLDLALKIAIRNLRTVAYVEREAQACAGLAARMQDGSLDAAPIWSDLSTFDGRRFRGLVDCVVSSDPCQPNSVAGSRLGAADDRFLIDQLIRVIDEVRPSRVFRENVTGNADGQLAALVPSLEGMGYSVAAGIFSAAEVGASHRRERLFIMADASDKRFSRAGRIPQSSSSIQQSGNGDREEMANAEGRIGRMGETEGRLAQTDITGGERELADAESLDDGGLSKREGEEHARLSMPRGNMANAMRSKSQGKQPGKRKQNGREVENGPPTLQSRTGLPYFAPGPNDPRWPDIIQQAPSLEPALCAMADGVANRVDELRAAGNGVCAMAGAVAWLSLSAHFEQAR